MFQGIKNGSTPLMKGILPIKKKHFAVFPHGFRTVNRYAVSCAWGCRTCVLWRLMSLIRCPHGSEQVVVYLSSGLFRVAVLQFGDDIA